MATSFLSGLLILSLSFTSSGAYASLICERQRDLDLTLPQQQALLEFANKLAVLDRYRDGSDSRGVTYAGKLLLITDRFKAKLSGPRMEERGAEFLLIENLRQAISKSIGIEDPVYREYNRTIRAVLFLSNMAIEPVMTASKRLRDRLTDWSHSAPIDAVRLQRIARVEAVVRLLDIVTLNTVRQADQRWQQVSDRLEMYKQHLINGLGASVFFGTIGAAGAAVKVANTFLGTGGLILAGCGIGASGAGSATFLAQRYEVYSTALIESINKNTHYSCELRQRFEAQQEGVLLSEVSHALASGAKTGCGLVTASLVAPHVVTWTVIHAVVIAAGTKVVFAVNDLYLARKSYLVYQSLKSYEKAELAARKGQRKTAEFYLHQSQDLARTAGAQALDAILIGAVIPAFVSGEVSHAFTIGREAIVALIGKSSDNAAIAAQMIAKFAASESTTPSGKLE